MLHYEMSNKENGYFFEIEPILVKQTKYQELVIGKNKLFGKIMLLDGVIQIAESDEASYHEPLVHVPIAFHGNVKKVLILGGGDGCLAREVLKHKSVEKLVMVDIDGDVVEVAKKELVDINKNPFADPRMETIVGDALKYVKETNEKFDVVFMDLVDPEGKGKILYTKESINLYKSVLNKGGVLASHVESPSAPGYAAEKLYITMKKLAKYSLLYHHYVKSFDDMWSFIALSDSIDFEDEERKRKAKKIFKELELRALTEKYIDALYFQDKWILDKIKEFEEKGIEELGTTIAETGEFEMIKKRTFQKIFDNY